MVHREDLGLLIDANVGKLVPWLRALGLDTVFAGSASDDEVLRRAERDGRVLITRDRALAGRRAVTRGNVRAVLIRSEVWREQLGEVVRALPIRALAAPFTRCLACNALLASSGPARAWRRVPAF